MRPHIGEWPPVASLERPQPGWQPRPVATRHGWPGQAGREETDRLEPKFVWAARAGREEGAEGTGTSILAARACTEGPKQTFQFVDAGGLAQRERWGGATLFEALQAHRLWTTRKFKGKRLVVRVKDERPNFNGEATYLAKVPYENSINF